MSRKSDAKKARRRKRQAARDANWTPGPGEIDEVTQAVAVVDEWITGRGWVLDDNDSEDDLVSWFYPPSATEFDDENLQPVTRMWIAVEEDDAAVVLEFGAVLVGADDDADDDGVYLLDPETLVRDIIALEDYRPGDPRPSLD